ncbi:ChbG/HpnK family deacetylase [Methylomonas sp. AM2-LC]|uniref:carbohydrate deacetylase n=1 Tax=Methylomonas sp. AM2-LC TaxID=3153301 RepID=UPI003267C080
MDAIPYFTQLTIQMTKRLPINLIVNADDYAYFPAVSRGILDAAKAGKLSATGIIANKPNLTTQLEQLDTLQNIDLGVHLNLTSGEPCTEQMRMLLDKNQGLFPSAYRMSLMILNQKISIQHIRQEWHAQIEACGGRRLVFLNSHEHIHMLPILFPLILQLANDFNIPFVRLTKADWLLPMSGTALVRNILMQGMASINQWHITRPMPIFLGLGSSGKLTIQYLDKLFATLKPGQTYELMCHPGYFAADEIIHPQLIAYHHWEQELALLQSAELQNLYDKFGIFLGRYHH